MNDDAFVKRVRNISMKSVDLFIIIHELGVCGERKCQKTSQFFFCYSLGGN